MTLEELVEAAASRLDEAGVAFGHGTDNAFDEAAWLALWQLGLPIDEFDEVAGMAVSRQQQDSVMELVEERIRSRRPAAYLTREAWLQGFSFYVDERTIVPRSFIAELVVDGTIDAWLADAPARLLDLCTGNGSLAVIAAHNWPDAQVDAADISAAALEVARINIDRHELAGRVRLVESDGLASLQPPSCGPYDLVLCNPPYVNAQSMAALPGEYRAEPELALAGGADGMDFIRPLLRELPSHLAPHGVLVLEIGNEREHFERAFPNLECAWLETSAGEDQVLLVTRAALLAR